MTDLVAEFTIEPFEASSPGPHVRAAIDAAHDIAGRHDIEVDVGPFGTSVEGPEAVVLEVVDAVNRAAISHGATRVSLQLTRTNIA